MSASQNPSISAFQKSLRKDEFWAVNDVSFQLRRGECLGLIGHNGAGKTTLLKMLNGLIKPDHGRIEMRGRVGALIALGAGFNPILTGRENIYVNGAVLGMSKKEIANRIEEIIDFSEIREFIDAPVQSYSSGMQVRLGFSIASALRPDVLLLDEVLAVGDMNFQAKCFNRLGEMRRSGVASILVSHNMHHITRFCDRVVYLQKGRVAYAGPKEEAVEVFLDDMMQHEAAAAPEDASIEIESTGSRTVVIEDAFFTTLDGKRVEEIDCGDSVRLVLYYRCTKDSVINPVVEVGLRDPAGEAWFHASNRTFGISLGLLEESGFLTVTFPALPANNQVLNASVTLWNSSMDELIYWCRGLKLKVRGRANSTGKVLVDCRWDHQPKAEPQAVA